MTEVSNVELQALFFKMMANKDRLKIMNSVKAEEKTVTQICKDTGFEQTWVSHSLKLLRDNGMVESRRDGKYMYYKLDNNVKPVINTAEKIAPKYKNRLGGG